MAAIMLGIFTSEIHAQDAYVCIANRLAAGFNYVKTTQKWVATTAKNDNKYLLKRSADSKYTWKVSKVGEVAVAQSTLRNSETRLDWAQ